MKEINTTVQSFKESIFATMSALAVKNEAINLGQGFPDFDGPLWIRDLARNSFDGKNQYAPAMGVRPLRSSISNYYKSFYGLNFDIDSQVTVTNGATEAIFSTCMALINPLDEVIVLEPFYDSYLAAIRLAGGIPVPVTLKAPEFSIDLKELEDAFSDKTKMIFFNSPHNPTGKVFSKIEMEDIARLVIKHDTYLVSDEVYEFLTFDGLKHLPIATLEGMRDRVVTISSGGKTFGLTGWKIGWITASEELSHAIRMVHQFNTFSVCTPLQFAVAEALSKLESYVPEFIKEYSELRSYFIEGIKALGFKPLKSEGTYFVLVPTPKELSDIKYCEELIKTKKVASIPLSPFYSKSNEGEDYVRFCFAKKKETLAKALENLT
ncbi:MAG: aspartate/methionine/tyrosine aminotransferase [Bacteriovoracaceae bacterium]|jgi:aspartate/methionine/tyrosine aminotransferase